MRRDLVEMVDEPLSEDPTKLGKLASNVQWVRMQLVVLRELLIELRKLSHQDLN